MNDGSFASYLLMLACTTVGWLLAREGYRAARLRWKEMRQAWRDSLPAYGLILDAVPDEDIATVVKLGGRWHPKQQCWYAPESTSMDERCRWQWSFKPWARAHFARILEIHHQMDRPRD